MITLYRQTASYKTVSCAIVTVTASFRTDELGYFLIDCRSKQCLVFFHACCGSRSDPLVTMVRHPFMNCIASPRPWDYTNRAACKPLNPVSESLTMIPIRPLGGESDFSEQHLTMESSVFTDAQSRFHIVGNRPISV